MSLLKTISDIKKYVPINKNTQMDTMQPFIDMAELTYIIPAIGQELYDEINILYQYGYPLSAENQKLLPYIQRALAYYSMYEAAPQLNLMVGDLGIQEAQSKDGTSSPARQWNFNNYLSNCIENADRALDAMLKFLEDNVSDYSTWAQSDAYTIDKELFISTAIELTYYIKISGSRSTYNALRPFIKIAERKYILPAIGQQQFDDLKSRMQSGYETDLDKILISKIKMSLAWHSLFEAIPHLPLNVSGAGIRVISVNDSIVSKQKSADINIKEMAVSARANGDSYLSSLKFYLDQNVEDYPLYKASDAYTSETKYPNNDLPDNTNKSDFWT
jgi:hypothetical protein